MEKWNSNPFSPRGAETGISRRALLGKISAAAALPLLPGFALAQEADKPRVIRFSTGAGSPFGVPYSGGSSGPLAALGFVEEEFKDDGIAIEWFHLTGGGPASNEALASGAVDFGYSGDFPAIFARSGGLQTRLIGGGFRGNNGYLVVRGDSSVTSLSDLLGKKIAIQKGQPWEYGFDAYLRSEGHTQADFQVLNLTFPDTLSAFDAGEIDAAYLISGVFQPIRDGKVKVIWSTRDAPDQWKFVADWFVSEDFAQKHPDIVQRVVKAIVRHTHHVTLPENRQQLFETWALTGYPINNYEQEWAEQDLRFRLSPIPDAFLVAHYQQVADYLLENRLIRRPVNVPTWVDRSYVDAAIADLGLEGYFREYDAHGNPIS